MWTSRETRCVSAVQRIRSVLEKSGEDFLHAGEEPLCLSSGEQESHAGIESGRGVSLVSLP